MEKQGLLPQGHKKVTGGDADYMALSPHAGYDAQRGVRAIQKKMEHELESDKDEDFNLNKSDQNEASHK